MTAIQPFNKYREQGAYHYDATIGAKHWRRFDIKLAARYFTAVSLLDPKPRQHILDAGSGEGVAALLCCRRQASAIAVEFEEEACRLGRLLAAREGFAAEQLSFAQYDLYRLPFADGTFDGIVSLEVIEHMADVLAYLAELKRVLKPGGRIVISTPHRRADGLLQDPYHVLEFDGATLADTMIGAFGHATIWSGWSARLNRFYDSNAPFRLVGQIKRNAFRLFARCGHNVFVGGSEYNAQCPIIYAVASKA